ncbi:MAG TPA: HlyD family type I secretion periplasmic adaptor subunit [Telluria sp.]
MTKYENTGLEGRIQADPRDFRPSLIRLQENPPNPLGLRVMWAGLAFLAGVLVWAVFSRLDIVAVAQGKLVPETYLKIVQPTDAGVVREILVRENQPVKMGQVLIRMDTALSESDLKALSSAYDDKRLALRRIDAQLAGAPLLAGANDPAPLFAQVLAQYAANRQAYENAIAQENSLLEKARNDLVATREVRNKLVQTLPYYREQEAAYEKLMREGYAGKLMLTDKRRERIEKEQDLRAQEAIMASAQDSINQEQQKIAQITAEYRRQLQTERVEIAAELEQKRQALNKQEHRNTYLELKAPQDGVVKDLATHTIGTVTSPGTILMTLVPKGESLRAEVWVENDDIGFVHPHQEVKVKVAAYTFQRYGMLHGAVAQVGADASDPGTGEGAAAGKPPTSTYKTLIQLNRQMLQADGHTYRLSPGMQVSAEIHLGTRSVLEYLLSPVTKAFTESARER